MKKNTFLQTSSQTVGPFFAYGLAAQQYQYDFPSLVSGDLRKKDLLGQKINVKGQVIDGNDTPIHDALVEIWQADPNGNYDTNPNGKFFGFGRMGTGSGDFVGFNFKTYKPGITEPNSAPHINITVFARGMLNHLFSRIYFSDEEEENKKDLLLNEIDTSLRSRLIAEKENENEYRFDIYLQGDKETVFFDV
tara:strand:- start:579 stop:1154 length:576 start_codon:yes stop_codon:yes gene_type:complete